MCVASLMNNRTRQALDASTPICHLGSISIHSLFAIFLHEIVSNWLWSKDWRQTRGIKLHSIIKINIITRETSSPHSLCFISEDRWAHIVLYNLNWYRGGNKIHGFNSVRIEDDNNHHYDYTGFLVGLLVVICVPYLLVYFICHSQCNEGKRNTFRFGIIFHDNAFKQPVWYLGNISDSLFVIVGPISMYGVTKTCHNYFRSFINCVENVINDRNTAAVMHLYFFAIKLS